MPLAQPLGADGVVEFLLRPIARRGAAEDIRQQPHPGQQGVRPDPLLAQAAEAQAAVQLPADDDRHGDDAT